MPGGIFTASVSVLPEGRWIGQLHFAAGDRRGKRDLDFLDQIAAALLGRRRLAELAGGTAELAEEIAEPAGPFLAESLAEKLAQVDVLGAKFAGPGPAPPAPGDQFHDRAPGGSPAPIVSKELP